MLESFGNPAPTDLVMGRNSTPSGNNAPGDMVTGNRNSAPDDLVVAKTTSIRQNLEAIVLLKDLQTSQRRINTQENAILSKFNGWGAFWQVFKPEHP